MKVIKLKVPFPTNQQVKAVCKGNPKIKNVKVNDINKVIKVKL